ICRRGFDTLLPGGNLTLPPIGLSLYSKLFPIHRHGDFRIRIEAGKSAWHPAHFELQAMGRERVRSGTIRDVLYFILPFFF
ncbi:hypothetical protein GBAR_LOCUS18951, partial [Geodia barretti]